MSGVNNSNNANQYAIDNSNDGYRQQYNQYLNIFEFATYRHFTAKNEKLDITNFKKEISLNEYLLTEWVNSAGKLVMIYLFAIDSKYVKQSSSLYQILNKIKKPTSIILISKIPFKIYALRVINEFKHLNIKSYLHSNFDTVIPKGPRCHLHRILSKEEIDIILNEEIYRQLYNLPKIFEEDAQCIWIGAEVGDVIEVRIPSDICGEFVQYRVVIPRNGNINIKEILSNDVENEDDKQEDKKESDDEFNEHRTEAIEIAEDDNVEEDDTKDVNSVNDADGVDGNDNYVEDYDEIVDTE